MPLRFNESKPCVIERKCTLICNLNTFIAVKTYLVVINIYIQLGPMSSIDQFVGCVMFATWFFAVLKRIRKVHIIFCSNTLPKSVIISFKTQLIALCSYTTRSTVLYIGTRMQCMSNKRYIE